VIMLMDFPFRGLDEVRKIHHGTRCRRGFRRNLGTGKSLSFVRP
jgi:hypothetical protein